MVALDEPHVESVLSVMRTCGMYNASGEWMFRAAATRAPRRSRLGTNDEAEVLAEHGAVARALELQGELYLGTAERVLRQVIAVLDEVDIVVLDCGRVTPSVSLRGRGQGAGGVLRLAGSIGLMMPTGLPSGSCTIAYRAPQNASYGACSPV